MRLFFFFFPSIIIIIIGGISPKRSRRDGKPVAERVPSSNNLDNDHTHRRRLQDAVPLEAPSVPYSKGESGSLAKDSDKKPNGFHEQAKGSSDPTEAPRSRSFFQVFVQYEYSLYSCFMCASLY